MSQVAIAGNLLGAGILTIAAPNTASSYTLTLPQINGTMVSSDVSGNVSISGDLNTGGKGYFINPVYGTTGAVVLQSNTTNTATTWLQWTNNTSTIQYGAIGVSAVNTMTFLIGSVERMRITAAGGLGLGTTTDPGAGAIYATGNITAFYSSDAKFKENIQPITGACETIRAIGGDYFNWTDEYIAKFGGVDGYFLQKEDFGVIAQKVQRVFPKAVRTRPDGTLAVDYEKLGILAFPAIIEILDRLDTLEAKVGP